MEWLTTLLSGLEVPFPIAFVIILAAALYVLGNKIKKKSDDPCDPTPTTKKLKITKNNLIIGILACIVWMGVNYFTLFGFVFLPILIQYVIVAIIAGITAAGFSTVVYEIIKNHLKLKAIQLAEELGANTDASASETNTEEEKTNDTSNGNNSISSNT